MVVILVYLSTDENIKRRQWEVLHQKRRNWGQKWIMGGGDFNDILGPEDKKGGRRRGEASFLPFRSFLSKMEMEVLPYNGRRWTWANNRVGEGLIEERLDMIFGLADWILEKDKAEVTHYLKHSSDHSMLLLDTQPDKPRRKTRFIFENRWCTMPGCSEVVQSSWKKSVAGSRMFQFQSKVKHVRAGLIEWRKKESVNARKPIDSINLRLNSMCEEEGQRDWEL